MRLAPETDIIEFVTASGDRRILTTYSSATMYDFKTDEPFQKYERGVNSSSRILNNNRNNFTLTINLPVSSGDDMYLRNLMASMDPTTGGDFQKNGSFTITITRRIGLERNVRTQTITLDAGFTTSGGFISEATGDDKSQSMNAWSFDGSSDEKVR